MNCKDIEIYGDLLDRIDLDINITNKLYRYENKLYLITMKNGEYISCYQVYSTGIYKEYSV